MRQEIADLEPWFHNLHLPDGTQTAPHHSLGDFPAYKWKEMAAFLPPDLNGWTALDIGCNAGYYSFELARRGARVVAMDVNGHYLAQAQWAARRLGLEDTIEFRQMQVYDFADSGEQYDLVLFLGVFYHLRYPLLGLDIAARMVRRLMLFQTLTMPGLEVREDTDNLDIAERDRMLDPGWPKMAFIEHSLAHDPTNWWAPNHAGVEALLRSAGFRLLAHPGHEVYLCEPDPDNPSCVTTWNSVEYLAATGQNRP
ncbi:MAG: TIGR04290 family methyltransferase [Candidatus Zixiibacteriota bacterium]|nr:MAG: TIGR04290 family methyltransferase [candidate division Zixibacteria bacterium]